MGVQIVPSVLKYFPPTKHHVLQGIRNVTLVQSLDRFIISGTEAKMRREN